MYAVDQQPTIVFTPSTPTLSTTNFDVVDNVASVYPSRIDESDSNNPHRRASFFRSFSAPAPPQQAGSRQPVVLHRSRPTSPSGARWTLAKARQSLLESCWKSESHAVASAVHGGLNEKPLVGSRTMSEVWTGRGQPSWADVDDDGDSSEPDSTPSTPVFPHRVVSSSSTQAGSRAITLISTLVIALAFASLAFTTFLHPTFGDKISKLPEVGDLYTPQPDQAWTHRFLHFDGLFGHSDDDGLVGISSSDRGFVGSNDPVRDLRKRTPSSSAEYYGAELPAYLRSFDPPSSSSSDGPNNSDDINKKANVDGSLRRWMPWHWPSATSGFEEDDEKIAEHRRNVDEAAQRMKRRRAALEMRLAAQQRW